MELGNLTSFLKIAELNSFSHAAKKLGYTQSAITIQMKQLEKELGIKLFDRLSKGVSLTKEGELFRFYANEIVHLASEATTTLQTAYENKNRDISGTLRIGSIESVSTALLPQLLAKFHKQYPHVHIIIDTKGRDLLINDILNNNIDLFFTFENKRLFKSMTGIHLNTSPVVFVSPFHYFSTKQSLSLKEICQHDFILTEKGESYRDELDKILTSQNIILDPIIELSNTETILHLIENHTGLSFVPLFSVNKALKNNLLSLIKVDVPSLEMDLQLFYHQKKWLTPQAHAFIEFTKDYFNNEFKL